MAALLHELLTARGTPARLTSTPSSSAIGKLARGHTFELHGHELTCLVAADRYHHYRTTIHPALHEGMTVVCDRFMPSSLVFDQQDEVERRYVWSLYECLPSPDIAFILQGPPEQCAERAAARGTYSRFHDTSEEHSRQECGMFQDAAHFLKLVGYPVYEHEIGANSAEAVTNDLLNVIAERNEGRA